MPLVVGGWKAGFVRGVWPEENLQDLKEQADIPMGL